jgi:hypothetical protein
MFCENDGVFFAAISFFLQLLLLRLNERYLQDELLMQRILSRFTAYHEEEQQKLLKKIPQKSSFETQLCALRAIVDRFNQDENGTKQFLLRVNGFILDTNHFSRRFEGYQIETIADSR